MTSWWSEDKNSFGSSWRTSRTTLKTKPSIIHRSKPSKRFQDYIAFVLNLLWVELIHLKSAIFQYPISRGGIPWVKENCQSLICRTAVLLVMSSFPGTLNNWTSYLSPGTSGRCEDWNWSETDNSTYCDRVFLQFELAIPGAFLCSRKPEQWQMSCTRLLVFEIPSEGGSSFRVQGGAPSWVRLLTELLCLYLMTSCRIAWWENWLRGKVVERRTIVASTTGREWLIIVTQRNKRFCIDDYHVTKK